MGRPSYFVLPRPGTCTRAANVTIMTIECATLAPAKG
ncbi:hypothetical protein GGC65_003174 [Sphingopyxis sp. OAS728]|nr:hypothetical protein [Sphingopyxis sp. OAS728]